MKLRIKGNSIRFRLIRAEVTALGQGKKVQEVVPLGNQFPPFGYALSASADTGEIQVHFQDHILSVILPQTQAQQWAASNLVGIEENIIFENGDTLHLLIEKDFQCLHKRTDEDESDHFPNPGAGVSNPFL